MHLQHGHAVIVLLVERSQHRKIMTTKVAHTFITGAWLIPAVYCKVDIFHILLVLLSARQSVILSLCDYLLENYPQV